MLLVLVVVAATASLGVRALSGKTTDTTFRTAKVERGELVAAVTATGTLNPVTTVSVGTQVSGTILQILVDYNSAVKRGQVIARLDPATFSAQVEQARGSLMAAEANREKAKVTAVDARRTLERTRRLLTDGIVSQSELDTAQTAADIAQAGVRGGEASVIQMRGSYNQARTNLENTIIRSPVDGVVISRSVDVGQTVAASLQTPTLFSIAQDLTRMQIETSVDEADISAVKVGQPVSFTIDAYPGESFKGSVTQVRNAPVTVSNVVTYVVVVGVDNRELKLKAGMTANVSIETARRENILKVTSAALRFRPEKEKGPVPAAPSRGKAGSGEKVYLLGPDGNPRAVAITTGLAGDGFAEVVSGGLRENDAVITGTAGGKKSESAKSGPTAMGPRL
ncbi:MAG: efflux RND transporter periplasmic adaptor subunit [Geobacter sp.]|nr:efflux RND transporter periplasmic adaptor subunit [Geobacter sp.]